MIQRKKPERFRLRRTMIFLSAQKPGLIKDPLIYGADSLMLDLEDAVAENQKDAARFSLYQALKTVDYGDTEVIVRINGLDTPHWREDVRVCGAAAFSRNMTARSWNGRMRSCPRRRGRRCISRNSISTEI